MIAARRAGVAAARAKEEGTSEVDEFQLRLRPDYDQQDLDLRVTARVPVKRPGEVRAQREILRAETEMALSKLEEASLERRAELCFPSVVALVHSESMRIYTRYADRQRLLSSWNEEWRSSGLIDELKATGFALESKTQIATRKPSAIRVPDQVIGVLPSINAGPGSLVLDLDVLREIVMRNHPSVAAGRASESRYRALTRRAKARRLPWLRFVDLSYESSTTNNRGNGFGGQLAFAVPIGSRRSADASRYQHLLAEESLEAKARLNDRLDRTLDALMEIQSFESGAERFRELEALATRAETIADSWRQKRLAKPSAVAALLDQAMSARTAVVDARERAAMASCALLALSGMPADEWPRHSSAIGEGDSEQALSVP